MRFRNREHRPKPEPLYIRMRPRDDFRQIDHSAIHSIAQALSVYGSSRGGEMADITAFREEVRDWLNEHCPDGARVGGSDGTGDAMQRWRDALVERGWTVPTLSLIHI